MNSAVQNFSENFQKWKKYQKKKKKKPVQEAILCFNK